MRRVVSKIVQAYYETYSSFSGLSDYLTDNGVDVKMISESPSDFEEQCYRMLGYSSDSKCSAKERAMIRKDLMTGQLSKLKKRLRVSSDKSLQDVLKANGLQTNVVRHKPTTHKFSDEILTIARYILDNEEIIFSDGNNTISSKAIFNQLCVSENIRSLRKLIPKYLPHLKSSVIDIVCDESLDCAEVVGGVLRTPNKVSLDDIASVVLEEVGSRCFEIHYHYYYYILRHALLYQFLSHVNVSEYLNVLDISYCCGTTVKGLFELCRFQYVNQLDIFRDVGCLVYFNSNGMLNLVSLKEKYFKYSSVSYDDFTLLYQNDCLRTLEFDVAGGYVTVGGIRRSLGE
jgi:hypothetical protein